MKKERCSEIYLNRDIDQEAYELLTVVTPT